MPRLSSFVVGSRDSVPFPQTVRSKGGHQFFPSLPLTGFPNFDGGRVVRPRLPVEGSSWEGSPITPIPPHARDFLELSPAFSFRSEGLILLFRGGACNSTTNLRLSSVLLSWVSPGRTSGLGKVPPERTTLTNLRVFRSLFLSKGELSQSTHVQSHLHLVPIPVPLLSVLMLEGFPPTCLLIVDVTSNIA